MTSSVVLLDLVAFQVKTGLGHIVLPQTFTKLAKYMNDFYIWDSSHILRVILGFMNAYLLMCNNEMPPCVVDNRLSTFYTNPR